MESYSPSITCSRMASFPASWSLNSRKAQNWYKMLFWINFEFIGLKLNFSQDVLFIGCNNFHQVTSICLYLIKNVSLGFTIYERHF